MLGELMQLIRNALGSLLCIARRRCGSLPGTSTNYMKPNQFKVLIEALLTYQARSMPRNLPSMLSVTQKPGGQM